MIRPRASEKRSRGNYRTGSKRVPSQEAHLWLLLHDPAIKIINREMYVYANMSSETRHATEQNHQAPTEGVAVMEGESVLQNRRPGWGLWWKYLLAGGFIALFMLAQGIEGVFVGLVVLGLAVGYVYIARSQSRYIVTDERVKMEIGLIRSESREYRISDLQGLDTSQSLIGKLLGIGDISVRAADGTQIPWRGVPDHDEVARTIREHQRQYDATMDRKTSTD